MAQRKDLKGLIRSRRGGGLGEGEERAKISEMFALPRHTDPGRRISKSSLLHHISLPTQQSPGNPRQFGYFGRLFGNRLPFASFRPFLTLFDHF